MTDRNPLDFKSQKDDEAKRDKAATTREFRDAEDFKWVMSDKRGRRFIYRLLAETGLHRNAYTGNSETFFRCGQISIGQFVQGLMDEHSPERYELMIKERKEK